jgi:hypothetical protein
MPDVFRASRKLWSLGAAAVLLASAGAADAQAIRVSRSALLEAFAPVLAEADPYAVPPVEILEDDSRDTYLEREVAQLAEEAEQLAKEAERLAESAGFDAFMASLFGDEAGASEADPLGNRAAIVAGTASYADDGGNPAAFAPQAAAAAIDIAGVERNVRIATIVCAPESVGVDARWLRIRCSPDPQGEIRWGNATSTYGLRVDDPRAPLVLSMAQTALHSAMLRKQAFALASAPCLGIDERGAGMPGTQPALLMGCNAANELGRLDGAIRGGAVEDGLGQLAIEYESGDLSYAAASGCGEDCTVLVGVAMSRSVR